MGSGSSKKVVKANSLQKKLNRPFPRVTEHLLFTNNHSQFVALVCKINIVAKKFVPSQPQHVLPFKDNEGGRFTNLESREGVNLYLQSGTLLKDKISEEVKAVQRESEENETEIINTWEIMEGLDYGDTYHVSKKEERGRDTLSFNSGDILQELSDQSPPSRISKGSQSPEFYHTVGEYDAFLARSKGPRSKRPLWDRKSKRYLYYFGHDYLNKVRSTSLCSLSSDSTQRSLQGRKMAPSATCVIDWKEDSKDEDDSTVEFPVLQPSFELKYRKHYVDGQENKYNLLTDSENNSSEENNGIPEMVSENIGSQGNNQSVEANIGNINMVETNSEKDQSLKKKSCQKRMQIRAKLNDLEDIIIPTTPNLSAVGSLKEWMHDGEYSHSPAETSIPRFGYSGFRDIRPKLNAYGCSGQPSCDEAERETYSFPLVSIDGAFADDGESNIYFGCGDSGIENEACRYHPPFDPELLASLDKDLKQLSKEEQHLLRQIDGDSNLLCGKLYAKGNEIGLQDSNSTDDSHMRST